MTDTDNIYDLAPAGAAEVRVAAGVGRANPDSLSTRNVRDVCHRLWQIDGDRPLPDDIAQIIERGRKSPHALASKQVQACCELLCQIDTDALATETNDAPLDLTETAADPDSPPNEEEIVHDEPAKPDRNELAAAVRAAAGDSGAGTTRDIAVDRLMPCPLRPPRAIDEAKLSELAASIATKGVLQPLLVRPTERGHEIVVGERRWRAARMAGQAQVPAIVLTLTDREVIELLLVENLQRQDIAPLEEAEAYRRLVDDHDMSHDDIASAVGKSRSHVVNTIRLLQLPGQAKALIAGGRVTAGHARAALACDDPVKMLREVAEEGASVRVAEDRARGGKEAQRRPRNTEGEHPRRPELESRLAEATGLPLRLRLDGEGQGQLSSKVDVETLDRLLARFGPEHIIEEAAE